MSRHRKAIERMYTDRATIKRNVEIEAPNKATRSQLQQVYADQPCRLSQKQLASNGQTEAQNEIRYETKLFITPDLDIRQGDVIEVVRGTRTIIGKAGEPFPYSTHQELTLLREGYA